MASNPKMTATVSLGRVADGFTVLATGLRAIAETLELGARQAEATAEVCREETATQAREAAEADVLAEVREAWHRYRAALDARQHGGIAAAKLVDEVTVALTREREGVSDGDPE